MDTPPENSAAPVSSPGPQRSWRWRLVRWAVVGLACLLTLLALFHAVENWRGRRAWAAYRASLVARGEPLDFAALVPAPVPDEQNFAAAPVFARVFAPGFNTGTNTLDLGAQPAGATRSAPATPWRLGQRLDLAAWQAYFQSAPNPTVTPAGKAPAEVVLARVDQQREILEELRAYSPRPRSRYAVEYTLENPFGIRLPHLAVVKQACTTLLLRSRALLDLGRVEEAAADVDLIFRLADSVSEGPFLIDLLVRLAGVQIAGQAVWEGLQSQQWTAAQLERWQQHLARYALRAELLVALRAERAGGLKMIELIRRQPELIGDIVQGGSGQPGEARSQPWMPWLIPQGWLDFEQLNYCRLMQEQILDPLQAQPAGGYALAGLRAAIAQFDELTKRKDPVRAVLGHRVLSYLLVPAVQQVSVKVAYGDSTAQLASVACALERHRLAHGRWPDTLADLVPAILPQVPKDIVTGRDLVYRPAAAGPYGLYSTGWNEQDDGGRIVNETDKPGAPIALTQGDWTWPQPQTRAPAAP